MQELKAPLDVGFQITGACNLKCRYCYARDASSTFVAVADAERIASEFLSAGVFSVSIEGGEPLLHPKWEEITSLFVNQGIDVAVITNGTVFDQHTIASLTAFSKRSKFFSIQVSLDSYDPTVNDLTRGRGSDVVQNIIKLADAGIDVAVATVIQSANAESAIDTIERLRCCVRRFHMMNLMPIPRTKNSCPELFMDEKHLLLFWDRISRFRDENPEIQISSPDVMQNSSMGIGCFSCKGCVAGTTRATVSPDLLLLPCGLCPDWIIGDLKSQTLEQAWSSDNAKIIRNLETPPCMLRA